MDVETVELEAKNEEDMLGKRKEPSPLHSLRGNTEGLPLTCI